MNEASPSTVKLQKEVEVVQESLYILRFLKALFGRKVSQIDEFCTCEKVVMLCDPLYQFAMSILIDALSSSTLSNSDRLTAFPKKLCRLE